MFAEMSLLRIIGLVLGIVLLLVGIRRVRLTRNASRVPAVVLLLAGAALVTLTAFPDLVRPLQGSLGLEGEPLGRLMTVLIVAVALCFLLAILALSRADRTSQRLGRLVRSLAAAEVAAPGGERWDGILVVVPAYNEAASLAAVLREIPRDVEGHTVRVLVVDDGSRDETAAVARAAGAVVASHPVNSGQGAALQTGYLIAERVGAQVVVTMDADGQHDPAQLPALVGPILEDRADFVVGSRRLGEYEADSVARNAGITIYTRLINALGGTSVSDVANGYRAIRVSLLPTLVFTEDQFHNPELLLGAARGGFRVVEVPVTIRVRAEGTSKKGGSLRYGAGFLRAMLKSWLR